MADTEHIAEQVEEAVTEAREEIPASVEDRLARLEDTNAAILSKLDSIATPPAPIESESSDTADRAEEAAEQASAAADAAAQAAMATIAAADAVVEAATPEPVEEAADAVTDTTNGGGESSSDSPLEKAEEVIEEAPQRVHALFRKPFHRRGE